MKKCMEYEVEGDRTKKTWTEVVQKGNREDAVDCSRWRQQIKDD